MEDTRWNRWKPEEDPKKSGSENLQPRRAFCHVRGSAEVSRGHLILGKLHSCLGEVKYQEK
jgi:hypothetical protein